MESRLAPLALAWVNTFAAVATLAVATTVTDAWAIGNDGSGLKVSLAADLVAGFGDGERERFDPREAEIIFYAPVDALFDAQVSAAAHRESGASFFELHEAFISSSKLAPGFRFRAGHYFLGIGRLNAIHRHDWPFTDAPLGHQRFFGSEGVNDTGIEASYLLPLPLFLELTAGVTNGWTFGHAHTEGSRPLTPTHYARLASYATTTVTTGLLYGLNYLARNSNADGNLRLAGLDATFKWREGKNLPLLVQGDFWFRHLSIAGGSADRRISSYLFVETQFLESWRPGLRYDLISGLGPSVDRRQRISPQLSWKPSEFALFRATYDLGFEALGSSRRVTHGVKLQSTFFLGAHPSHEF